jgi:hypothetical protein
LGYSYPPGDDKAGNKLNFEVFFDLMDILEPEGRLH